MARVELDQLGKRYPNGFNAVKSFSIDIADGEFVVLVGPSGCGKSTSLRMVAGLETISSGELRIDGVRVNELPPKARDVAMVFQSYALYPHMTVFENIAFGLKLRKVPKDEIRRRVAAVAEQLEITDLLDRKPKAMSGGQRQRVAMGRAIARQARLFLFDEPLSNLDAKLRLHMRVQLGKLHRELGATSLYVTHDQVEAMTLADRIVVLHEGVVQQIGAPLDLYDRPNNLFVASFIGSPGMNLMPARLENELIVGDGFELPRQGRDASGALTVGLRPQDARLVEADAGFGAVVEVLEPMGSETWVHCRRDGVAVVARAEGVPALSPGQTVHIGFDPSRLHVFDNQSGARL